MRPYHLSHRVQKSTEGSDLQVSFWKSIYIATKMFAHISPICWEAPLVRFTQKFCMRGHLADVMNCAKFYLNQFSGFDFVGGRIFGFSIRKRSRR